MNKIRIKCPNCGVVLEAVDNPANADKFVTCPNCKVRNKFQDFARIDDSTEVDLRIKGNIGYIVDMTNGKQYVIKEGHNIVGRKPVKSQPKADIAIETSDPGMSREHMYIDAMKGCDGYYHIYVSNAKNKNATFINGQKLEGEDKIGLRHGDTLLLCDTSLRYVGSPLIDETELS